MVGPAEWGPMGARSRRRGGGLAAAVALGALLATAFATLLPAPVSAANLDPGSTIRIGWEAPDPALVLVGSCGNATPAGDPLPESEVDNPDHCTNWADLQIIDPYETGSGLVAVSPTPSYDEWIHYEWSEPIGSSGATCVHGAKFACRIEVTGIAGDFSVISTRTIDVWPATPYVDVTGPFEAVYAGSLFEFDTIGLASGGISGISACGNADATGIPLPAGSEALTADRCHTPLESGLVAGPGNHVVGGALTTFFGPTTPASGVFEWVDPIEPFVTTDAVTCVDDGNFDCAVLFGPVTVPVTPGPRPTVTAGAVTVDESSGTASLPLTLSFPIPAEVTVAWTTAPGTTQAADFTAASGIATFAPDTTSTTIDVAVTDDDIDEPDQSFAVVLSDPSNAEVGGFYGLGFVTIADDDEPPQVIPQFSAWSEPGGAFVRFDLSHPSEFPVAFDWETRDVTAVAGADYVAAAGQVTVEPLDTSAVVAIDTIDDERLEGDEFFAVPTSNHLNSSPGGFYGVAFVTIKDDEQDCLPLLGPGADLRFCDLRDETISDLDLSGADLRGARLDGATLVDVALDDADLSSAPSIDTTMIGTQFLSVDLNDASVSGSDLTDAIFTGSDLTNLDASVMSAPGAVFVNTTLAGADLSVAYLANAAVLGGSMAGADLDDAHLVRSTVLPADFTGVSLVGTAWGDETICPDGTTSGDHGDTCWRVPVAFGPVDQPPGPVTIQSPLFQATVHPSFQADPVEMYRHAWFGPTGFRSLGSAVFDVDGDGVDDRAYAFHTEGAPLVLGTIEYCLHTRLGSDAVYGCADLTVNDDPPPISPPASPPASPPVSGPISGVGDALAGLVPLLSGPVGLVLTASGVGVVFLLGSNRATSSLRGETREDDDEPPA